MYPCNQKLDITAEPDQLHLIIDTILRLSRYYQTFTRKDQPVRLAWKITENGKYFCIGVGGRDCDPLESLEPGWTNFTGTYSAKHVAGQVQKWLRKKPHSKTCRDAIAVDAVRCQAFQAGMLKNTGEDPDDYEPCIACFSPYVYKF